MSVRDPMFWHRFSVAAHDAEAQTALEKIPTEDWLAHESAKRRRAKIILVLSLCGIVFCIVAAVVVYVLFETRYRPGIGESKT